MEITRNFMYVLSADLSLYEKPIQCEGHGAKLAMKRVNENGSVVGTIIVNSEGFPETTTLDSLTAATYSNHLRNLSHSASNALKEIDVTDELKVLRLVSRKTEAVVVPDPEFHLIVVMRKQKK